MTFQEAQTYLVGLINETASRRMPNRLDRMEAFLEALGNPERRYPTIHVAGTSGKGSTATMIATVLQAAGKRTALHTKPHLSSITERARVNGASIPEESFGDLLGEMQGAIALMPSDLGRPTYYETQLALAFLWFARCEVDVAVIEAGIGGRLDGTNVLVPQVAIITNVGLDHTEILGETIPEIARDKAGVAKRGVPLVSASRNPDARREIEQACADVGAPFVSVVDTVRIETGPDQQSGQSFTVLTPCDRYEITTPLLGDFQQENAATAIRALEQLDAPLRPSRDAIEAGFARLRIPGRMELFPGHPAVVFDIAHNPDKAQHAAHALRRAFPNHRFALVLAIAESQDAIEVIRPFAALPASSFTFTSFSAAAGRIANDPERLASLAESIGAHATAICDPVAAFASARRDAEEDEVVVVTGSTFVVAELRESFVKAGFP